MILAKLNISFTNFAPSPINFWTSSEPTTSMKVAFVLWATAFANKVLPVPGGPYKRTPFGGLMPTFSNSFGFFKGSSITSLTSSISALQPPISFKFSFGFSMITNFSTSKLSLTLIFSRILSDFCSTKAESPALSSVTSLEI